MFAAVFVVPLSNINITDNTDKLNTEAVVYNFTHRVPSDRLSGPVWG